MIDTATMLWEEHLTALAKVACADEAAVVFLEERGPNNEGTLTLSASPGRPSPVILVNAALSRVEQEGVVLHESHHWRARDDLDAAYREAIRLDAMRHEDVARAPWERAADRGAIAMLDESAVRAVLAGPIDGIKTYLARDL